jgi:hypothetical protein
VFLLFTSVLLSYLGLHALDITHTQFDSAGGAIRPHTLVHAIRSVNASFPSINVFRIKGVCLPLDTELCALRHGTLFTALLDTQTRGARVLFPVEGTLKYEDLRHHVESIDLVDPITRTQQCETSHYIPDVDLNGGDIDGPTIATSAYDCCMQCLGSKQCFAWTVASSECWLKSEHFKRTSVSGVVSGMISRKAASGERNRSYHSDHPGLN